VLYDVGRVMGANWRPDYHPALVRRELEIIKTDLHCDAVKICGRDIDRLVVASSYALDLGLEVWFSPELWNKPPRTTLRHVVTAAAAAEELRSQHPEDVVFSVGTELTLFMRGILKGNTFQRRLRHVRQAAQEGAHNEPLNAFLAEVTATVRTAFHGPVTYASLPFEQVDWHMFDVVGIDHYWSESSKDRYLGTLDRLAAFGKPVVITEFGFQTHTGAGTTGQIGSNNVVIASMIPYAIPPLRRFARPRVKTVHERDEGQQARCLVRQLELLDNAGVDGAFVFNFVFPLNPQGKDPKHDLDTDSFSLVKSYSGGRRGSAYPDMTWDPKLSFYAVADYYAGRVQGDRSS
jgi:hypothetical protein